MTVTPEIELTEDGSQTLRHPVFGDSYHSSRGAVGESLHVFINEGFRRVLAQREPSSFDIGPLKILEVGFGSGLNAFLTATEAVKCRQTVEYHALEPYPVDMNTLCELDYWNDPLFKAIHKALWNEPVEVCHGFILEKHEATLQGCKFDTIFDLVYYDAFAYDTQPELWSAELFGKIASGMRTDGILVTYSSKGVVKENLRGAGFEVKRLPGALGKRHMLLAVKK